MAPASSLQPRAEDGDRPLSTLPREQILSLGASRIREIANAAMGSSDVLPFWFGESDIPTAEFIRQAGAESLAAGETFYTHNLGLPELREVIAAYRSRLHNADLTPERIAVVSSGISGLMLTAQMLLSPGDRVVIVNHRASPVDLSGIQCSRRIDLVPSAPGLLAAHSAAYIEF